MAPINTCVLGTGLSGLTFQIPFVLALPDLFTLHSVLERNPSSEGGRVKERFGVTTKIHRSLEDVLADGEIELVIVGTPNATHFEYAKRALGAGKHVLVEKPVVTTVAEARELGELAKSKNLVLYPYQNRRWDSDFLALRELLSLPASDPNSIGTVWEFESRYVFFLPICLFILTLFFCTIKLRSLSHRLEGHMEGSPPSRERTDLRSWCSCHRSVPCPLRSSSED